MTVTVTLCSVKNMAAASGLYYCGRCRRHHRSWKSKIGRQHLSDRVAWYSWIVSLSSFRRESSQRGEAQRQALRPAPVAGRRQNAAPQTRRRSEHNENRTQPRRRGPAPPQPEVKPWPNAQERLRASVADARRVAKRRLRTVDVRGRRDRSRVPVRIEPSLINYVFDKDGFYAKAADKIIEGLPYGRRDRRNHWVCVQLGAAAEVVDPGTYEKVVGDAVQKGLEKLGVDDFIAKAISTGGPPGIRAAFDATSFAELSRAFRALIPLVCPDLARCPQDSEVLRMYATPLTAEDLKRVAQALGAPAQPSPFGY